MCCLSCHLLTITSVNATLGIAVGTAMWLLDMPNPPLWGVTGMLIAVPMLGALKGIADTCPGLDGLSEFLAR